MEVRHVWQDAHMRQTFVRPSGGIFSHPVSTFGVMETVFGSLGELYSCGADGEVHQYDVCIGKPTV